MSGDSLPEPGWAPASCTLPTADRPVRLAEFDDVFSAAVIAVSLRDPPRVRLELEPGPETAARVAELAVRETGCCSFFTFTLVVQSSRLTLEVTAPPSRGDVLAALHERAQAVRSERS